MACFDKFYEINSTKKRIILLDNASMHTSYKFIENIEKLEKKGVFIKFFNLDEY